MIQRNNVRLAAAVFFCAASAVAQRDVSSFNDGWAFAKFGEQADGKIVDEPAGAQAETFNDATWRAVRLPQLFIRKSGTHESGVAVLAASFLIS